MLISLQQGKQDWICQSGISGFQFVKPLYVSALQAYLNFISDQGILCDSLWLFRSHILERCWVLVASEVPMLLHGPHTNGSKNFDVQVNLMYCKYVTCSYKPENKSWGKNLSCYLYSNWNQCDHKKIQDSTSEIGSYSVVNYYFLLAYSIHLAHWRKYWSRWFTGTWPLLVCTADFKLRWKMRHLLVRLVPLYARSGHIMWHLSSRLLAMAIPVEVDAIPICTIFTESHWYYVQNVSLKIVYIWIRRDDIFSYKRLYRSNVRY